MDKVKEVAGEIKIYTKWNVNFKGFKENYPIMDIKIYPEWNVNDFITKTNQVTLLLLKFNHSGM